MLLLPFSPPHVITISTYISIPMYICKYLYIKYYIHNIVKQRTECEVVCIAEKIYTLGNILFLIENVRASKYNYNYLFFFFIPFIYLLILLFLLYFFLVYCNITY